MLRSTRTTPSCPASMERALQVRPARSRWPFCIPPRVSVKWPPRSDENLLIRRNCSGYVHAIRIYYEVSVYEVKITTEVVLISSWNANVLTRCDLFHLVQNVLREASHNQHRYCAPCWYRVRRTRGSVSCIKGGVRVCVYADALSLAGRCNIL